MKPTPSSDRTGDFMWKLALWISSTAILGFLAFGAAVRVDFTDPEVPLSQAIGSLDWHRLAEGFRQKEQVALLAAGIAALVTFTVSRSWKVRAGVLAAGFLMPVCVEGPVMLAGAAVAPLMAAGMLAGKVDGEFYGEDLPQFAAAGLWMLVCGVYVIREAVIVLKQRKHAVGTSTKPLEQPLP